MIKYLAILVSLVFLSGCTTVNIYDHERTRHVPVRVINPCTQGDCNTNYCCR